jgi:hypothetical protein
MLQQQQQQPVNTEPTTSTGKSKRKRTAKEFLAVRVLGRLCLLVVIMKWKERLIIGTVSLALLSVVTLHIVSVVQMRSEAKATVVSSPSIPPSMPSFGVGVGNSDVPVPAQSSTSTSTTTPAPALSLTSTMATGAAVSAATTAASSGSRTITTAIASAVTQPPVATIAVAPLLVPLGQVGKPHVVGEYGVLIEKAVLICYQHYHYCPSDVAQPNLPDPATALSILADNQEPTPKFIVGVQVNLMSYQGSYYKKKVVAGAVTSLHFLTTGNGRRDGYGSGNSPQPAPAPDPRLFYLAATPPTQANPPLSDFRLLTPVEVVTLNSQLPAGARRSPVLDLTESGQGAKKELSFGESLSGWLFFEYEYKSKLADTDTAAATASAGGISPLLDSKTELEFRFYSNPDTSHTSGIPLRVRIAANQLTVLARF